MAKGDRYTWTFSGRQRTWDFAIQKEGFTTTATAMLAGAEAFLTWGRPSNELDQTLLPCDIKIEVIDPDLTLYNDLIDVDLEEDDFRLLATDSTGTYTLRMRVRLDTVETYLVPNLNEQVTSVYGYCGLSELKNIDALLLTSASIHRVFRDILSLTLISQNIEYLTGIYPTNIDAADPVLDLVRLNRLDLIFAEEGRKIDNMADQLQGMVDGWGVTAFNGLDGQWHVKNRWGLGETIGTGRGKQYYYLASNTLVSLPTLSQTTLTLTKPLIHRATTRRILKPIQAVEIERGTNREFITVDLMKHGDFETGWASSTSHDVWTVDTGSITQSTKSDTGTYALRMDSSSGSGTATQISHKIAYMAGSSQVFIEIALRHGMELITGMASGSDTIDVYLNFYPVSPGATFRTFNNGAWNLDFVTPTISISETPEANGTDPITYETSNLVCEAVLPEFDGYLYLVINNSAAADVYAYIDNLEIRLNNTSSEAITNFRSVFPRLLDTIGFFGTDIAERGEIAKQSRAWFNGVLGIDTDGDGTRDELHSMLQADGDGAGSWEPASQYTNESQEFATTTYDDLAKATSDARIAEQDEPAQIIEGEILGIVTPHTPFLYDSKTYIPVYARVDLKREITQVTAVEKIATFGLVAVAPTIMYFLDSNDRVRTAPIDLNDDPWTPQTVFTAGRTATIVRVDLAAGYIFLKESTGSVADYIKRYDLDGSNGTDIVTETWTTNDVIQDFVVDTANELVYVLNGFGATEEINIYQYDGTLDNTIALTNNSSVGQLAKHGDYIMYQATTDKLYKVIVSTEVETLVDNLTQPDNSQNSAALDITAGYYFYYHDSGFIKRTAAPDGGSETTIETSAVDQSGLAIDRANQLLYYGSTDRIIEIDYDGAGNRTVVDVQADTYDIRSIDLQ